MVNRFTECKRAFLAMLCLALLSACITLLAPYDEKTDQLATDLQRKISAHVEALDGAEAPACLHGNHIQFYDEARVDLSTLSMRVRALELNQLSIQQVDDLRDSLITFEALHKRKDPDCLTSAEISPLRRAFDSHLGAILKLELAKKRGEK